MLDVRTITAADLQLMHDADQLQATTPITASDIYVHSEHRGHAVHAWFDAVVQHEFEQRRAATAAHGIPPRMEDVTREIRDRILRGESFQVALDFRTNDMKERTAIPAPESSDPFANDVFLSEKVVPQDERAVPGRLAQRTTTPPPVQKSPTPPAAHGPEDGMMGLA